MLAVSTSDPVPLRGDHKESLIGRRLKSSELETVARIIELDSFISSASRDSERGSPRYALLQRHEMLHIPKLLNVALTFPKLLRGSEHFC
jgi:hypothetical protein